MKLRVEIYTGEKHAGNVTFAAEGGFSLEPSNSTLLRHILAEPVFVSIGNTLEDVYADKDPVLFIEPLASHYKSQGLRATHVKDLDGNKDDGASP